jgi:hypothetical protein
MVKRLTMLFGAVFIVVGVLGFTVPGGMQMGDPATAPKLLGLFPVNLLHNVVHIAIGVWGLAAGRAYSTAVAYCKLVGFVYLALAALGFVIPDAFGLIPDRRQRYLAALPARRRPRRRGLHGERGVGGSAGGVGVVPWSIGERGGPHGPPRSRSLRFRR